MQELLKKLDCYIYPQHRKAVKAIIQEYLRKKSLIISTLILPAYSKERTEKIEKVFNLEDQEV